jgi:hypothetical protein
MSIIVFLVVSTLASIVALLILGGVCIVGGVAIRAMNRPPVSYAITTILTLALVAGVAALSVGLTKPSRPVQANTALSASTDGDRPASHQPDWIGQTDWDVEGATTEVTVHGGRYASEGEAQVSLQEAIALKAIQYMLAQGMLNEAPQGTLVHEFIPAEIRDQLVVDSFVEKLRLESVDEDVYEAHARLRFDPSARSLLDARARNWRGYQRAESLGLAAAAGIGTLALIWAGLAVTRPRRKSAPASPSSPPVA